MSRSMRLLGVLLATTVLPATPVMAAAQSGRPAVQQREDRQQPDRWSRQDTRSATSKAAKDRAHDDDRDDSDDSDDSDDEDDDRDHEVRRHPGELNGKIDLDWPT